MSYRYADDPRCRTSALFRLVKNNYRKLFALALLCAGLCRAGAGGVTLITHGFNSSVDSWIVPMQGRVAQYGTVVPRDARFAAKAADR